MPEKNKKYAVLCIYKKALTNAGEIELSWLQGQIGAIPVFDNKNKADKFAANEYQVVELLIQE